MIKELYSILNAFKTPEFLIENKIHGKICSFIKENLQDKQLDQKSKLFYEKTAFLCHEEKKESSLKGWEGLHYGPMISIPTKNGDFVSDPDIKNITPAMVSYWEKRSSEVNNPVLQCRYAGLVWEFSQKIRDIKPDISVAQRFIDSIIQMTSLVEREHFLKYKLERGLRVAVSINDEKRIISVRDVIIRYEDKYCEIDKPGTWGFSFDLLIGDKHLKQKIQLPKDKEEKIIEELEKKLENLSNKESNIFHPHSVEYIAEKLAPYYSGKNDTNNMCRILLIYRDSFLKGNGIRVITGSIQLDKIRKFLFQYGLSKEAQELECHIRRLQKEDLKYFKKAEIPIKIPKQYIESYIKKLDERNLSDALHYITVSSIPDKEQAKSIVLETAKQYPLQALISQSIVDHAGRRTTELGSVEEDLEGRIVLQICQSIQLKIYWIVLGLDHLKKNKSLNENTFSKHLFKSFVFPERCYRVIKEGVTSYFNENYIASCSILIPQIESSIREIISQTGGAIYKSAGFDLRPLGSLLKDIKFIKIFEELNHNIPNYLQVLLTEKRGFNLRNSICHGLASSNFFNQNIATCVIHILLILSLCRFKNSDKELL